MKGFRRSAQFKLHYKQRVAKNEYLQRDFIDCLEGFLIDRFLVKDHSLKDSMIGKRSFSINNDYRVIYIEKRDYFLLLDIGTHEQVYQSSS